MHQESRRYGFDPELIIAVISTESSFYNWAISPKGAVGLMQIIPTTGKQVAEMNNIVWHGKDPLFDPFLNIRLGIHYLWMLYLKFGDIHLALTAYNHGPGKVIRWLKAGETIPTRYSEKVLSYYEQFLGIGGGGKGGPEEGGVGSDGEPLLTPTVFYKTASAFRSRSFHLAPAFCRPVQWSLLPRADLESHDAILAFPVPAEFIGKANQSHLLKDPDEVVLLYVTNLSLKGYL
ncbi:MAG: lytic transglycosylase domain-containing protein [Candidatus Manganitrophus sp.]|nr:MAG: lytic transglycosylase domain-containing protein [Candidatus Manganitrophus sp.]